MKSIKYGVIGSGAIGGFYGGKLAQSGKDVHFLFHSDFDYVSKNGLEIDSITGNFKIFPINAYNCTSEMPKCDVVFVCLKTTNNDLLKTMLLPLLHEKTVVILIQNGLGTEADLQKDFPSLQIAGAMAFICSAKVGDGHIKHMDQGSISIGSYSCQDNSVLEQVDNDFKASGIESNIVDLDAARWKKLIWNIPFNGMSVVLNTTTDSLLKNSDTRSLIHTLMLEVIRGANAVGKGQFSLDESLADKMISTTEKMVPYAPSMKLDFDHQRELELKYIYQKPIVEALSSGYDMKCTQMLLQQLRFIQEGYFTK